MNFRKRMFAWIKSPHGAGLILWYVVTIAAAVGAVLVATLGELAFPRNIFAYLLYAFAAITVGYSAYTFVVLFPKAKRNITERLQSHSFTNRLLEQYGFRTIIFTIFSFAISLGNAILNGAIGIFYLSLWYGAIGAYYLLLSLMRGGILLFHWKKKKLTKTETDAQIKLREVKSYRTCGILLILLPLSLSFAILEMVASGRAFVHSGMMIYVTALYTCYKVVIAIRNFYKARKGDDVTIRAVRDVNFADALVSVLALQTAMFHEFSADESIGTANAVTGAVVCALTAGIGIYMVVYGSLQINKLKKENEDGQS